MPSKIPITPPWFICTSKQGLCTKEYKTQISLNKINLSSKFEGENKVLKIIKTQKIR